MWLRRLFTVPPGQKVTEKMFGRVLVSSVCGMLLCMACLAGTTWAWFTVDIENTNNVLQIAAVTVETEVYAGETELEKNENNAYELAAGMYRVKISVANTGAEEPDSFGRMAHPVYVLMTVTKSGGTEYYCLPFERGAGDAEKELSITEAAVVSFTVSWIEPAATMTVGQDDTLIGGIPTEAPSEAVTEAPSAAVTEATQDASEAS